MTNADLTPEQIENWRRALTYMIGPYALIASVEEVQRIHDNMQRHANAWKEDEKKGDATSFSAPNI